MPKIYGLRTYTKTIVEETKKGKIPKMIGVIEGPVNKMLKAYPDKFNFMRHETKRSLRTKGGKSNT